MQVLSPLPAIKPFTPCYQQDRIKQTTKMPKFITNDSVHWYMNSVTSRIIAESRIPNDRFHLGKILLQCIRDDPDLVAQIDGGTGESETNSSLLQRVVPCAHSFRNWGLQRGDVIVLMAPNHLDLAIPFYAALFLGIAVAAVDRTLGINELQSTFSVIRPKIIFCQHEKASDIQIALNEIELTAEIVTFDKGDYLLNFNEFVDKYQGEDVSVEDFQAEDFEPEETIALLISTSGTTGLPKAAAVSHKNMSITLPNLWLRHRNPTPTRLSMIGSPLQWLTALITFIGSPIFRYSRLQSTKPLTQPHAYELINTYKPTYTILSPTLMTTLLKPEIRDQCDFTCFEQILLGGSAVTQAIIDEVKTVAPDAEVVNVFGMSELTNVGFNPDNPAPGSCGKPLGCFEYRIINVETMEDIEEPNVPGELWIRGPGIFMGYYNNPEATEETFAEGGWFKTGDMFSRDENYNYFFIERIKLLLKYKSYQISPVELENVIRQHPGVLDVAVTGIPDPECGDLPVACVVPQPGNEPTADEIKELVKETLSDAKQLRGGVIFLQAIPMTASTKVHRRKLKEIALSMDRE